MYCKNCGNEVNKNAVVCPCCGCSVQSDGTSKKGLGFVLGFFLGLIGLIIGLCMYDSTSVERKTFMKGWLISFIISIALSVIGVIIYFAALGSVFASAYSMALII